MKRRDLITGLAGAAVTPVAARAQQKTIAGGRPASSLLGSSIGEKIMYDTVGRGLSETGYTVGQNLTFERRWSGGQNDRLPALAAELVSRDVDMIVTNSTLGAPAAENATSTIPILFHSVPDSVRSGVVTSLARPGGNLAGLVPAMYVHPVYAPLGALISYGVDEMVTVHQAGVYAGRILSGARPADMPVQRPTAFVLAVNLNRQSARPDRTAVDPHSPRQGDRVRRRDLINVLGGAAATVPLSHSELSAGG
jgi:hypothetical protein